MRPARGLESRAQAAPALPSRKRPITWTDEEVQTLLEHKDKPVEELTALLSGKSVAQVKRKLYKLPRQSKKKRVEKAKGGPASEEGPNAREEADEGGRGPEKSAAPASHERSQADAKAAVVDESRRCCVCFDPPEELEVLLECGCPTHEGCVAAWATSKVADRELLVRCPDCQVPVKETELLALLRKYGSARQNLEALAEASLKHALQNKLVYSCKQPGCPGAYFRDSTQDELTCEEEPKCPACGKNPIVEVKMDAESESLVATLGCRQCPGCEMLIERESGCAKMRCRCGQRFCFKCGAKDASCTCTGPNHRFLEAHEIGPAAAQQPAPRPAYQEAFYIDDHEEGGGYFNGARDYYGDGVYDHGAGGYGYDHGDGGAPYYYY